MQEADKTKKNSILLGPIIMTDEEFCNIDKRFEEEQKKYLERESKKNSNQSS